MELHEFYRLMDGDYEEVHSRLLSSERIRKYLLLAAEDPAFSDLHQQTAAGHYDAAFRAAHTLKGILLSLGLKALLDVLLPLLEDLRAGGSEQTSALFDRFRRHYMSACAQIHSLS